jgi:hypothetical protein
MNGHLEERIELNEGYALCQGMTSVVPKKGHKNAGL